MMYLTALLPALPLLATSVAGLPVRRQAANATAAAATDLAVLQFANVLEQLETEFYSEALQKFQASDFTAAGFADPNVPIQQFTAIQNDESTHAAFLQSAIEAVGGSVISGCSFDFSSVLTSVSAMAPVARLVENVGVGAYLGAAHFISDPVALTDAASIVTIEARHQTMLNILNDGTAIPTSFDLPLLPQEVLAIAGGFISGCSTGFDALPSLTVTNQGTIAAGTTLGFQFDSMSSMDTSTLTCQMLSPDLPFSLSFPFSGCTVPQGLFGPVAIYVTNNSQPLNNNARDRFLGDIVAGPTMAFLDKTPEAIGLLAVSGTDTSSSSSSNSTSSSSGSSGSDGSSTDTASSSISTATISPDEASSILASASGTATASSASGIDAADSLAVPASANESTGPSSDGSVTVNGWSFVPAGSSS